MIDIHCHILPGLDDGPAHLEESIKMARLAADDGITTIVATPHVKDSILPVSTLRSAVAEMNDHLHSLGIPLTIMQGADVFALLDPLLLKDYTINGTSYILIEFPHTHLPRNAQELLFKIKLNGLRPIITHPERNPSIIQNPNLLLDLLTDDVLVQITADSISGVFGPNIQACAKHLLQLGAVALLASDGHSSTYRRPILSAGVRAAAKIIGIKGAEKLVTTNPEAVLAGNQLDA